MIPKELVGRHVRIVQWEHRDFVTAYLERIRLEDKTEGTITHVENFGGTGDVWVRIDGLDRAYAFGLDQLELLP